MANRRMQDAREHDRWPCPCCGYRTLKEGPGDYEVCPVCFWEDAGDQLRWPTLDEGPNGICLIEAQQNFVAFGACHPETVSDVRRPGPGEEREAGWRVIDPTLDDFETGPDAPGNLPWPADAEDLYWWRPTYFRRPENKRPTPAKRRAPSNEAERMMKRIIETVPETGPIDRQMRALWEEPAVLPFCGELASFVIDAVKRGDTELGLRIVNELNAGLASSDEFAGTCVAIGFLEPRVDDESRGLGFLDDELAEFVALWPTEIKSELLRQRAFEERERRRHERVWGPGDSNDTWRPTLHWKVRHPVLWWKLRHGGVGIAG